MSTGVTTASLRRTAALFAAGGLLVAAQTLRAQEAPSIAGTPRNIRIQFVPPPLEGTISLGIYDSAGKLVRVLHRESDIDELEAGSDALITHWDGKDDADQPLPPGKYHARGYVVGDIGVEGIGFYFNDWVSDARPERIGRICTIAAEADGVLATAQLKPGGSETLICDAKGEIVSTRDEPNPTACNEAPVSSNSSQAIAASSGRDHTQWVIEASADGTGAEVKQYSPTKELLRSLAIPPDQPQPHRIAASPDADTIFLLEQDAAMQQLRALTLVGTKPGAEHSDSDWRVDFEKRIVAHTNFGLENGVPVASGGEQPPEKLPMKLVANPLAKGEKTTIELRAACEDDDSALETADGLPLQTISETRHLTRAVVAPHDAKSIDVFQDDGAVVEQFRLTNLDQMMAFDCGEIELK